MSQGRHTVIAFGRHVCYLLTRLSLRICFDLRFDFTQGYTPLELALDTLFACDHVHGSELIIPMQIYAGYS